LKIGFIGLGNMGKPMAKNLMNAGYELKVFDVVTEALTEFKALGARTASSPLDAAADFDVVITMLPNSPHVEEVLSGPRGVFEGAKKGTLIIDMSSISPLVTKKMAQLATEKGLRLIDAPVTGGVAGAEKGQLGIIVGASSADLEEAKPIFDILGRFVHVGNVGTGQTAKMCNQVVVGLSLCAIAEAFTLGVKAGIDPEILHKVLSSGSARSWAMEVRVPQVLAGNFEPGFMINLQHKDIGIALDSGKGLNVPLPFTALAQQAYESAKALGLGTKDHSAVIQVYEKITGIKVSKETQ